MNCWIKNKINRIYIKKNLLLKITNFNFLKYLKYKNIGKNTIGIVLNLIRIEKVENIKTKKKYSFFSYFKFLKILKNNRLLI